MVIRSPAAPMLLHLSRPESHLSQIGQTMSQNCSSLRALFNRAAVIGGGLVTIFAITVIARADWPQFRGPDRSGIAAEQGLLKKWPAEGPPVAWKASKLGEG